MFPKKLFLLLLLFATLVLTNIYAEQTGSSFLEILFDSMEDTKGVDEFETDIGIDPENIDENPILKSVEPVNLPILETEPVELAYEAIAREPYIFEAEGEGWMLESYTDDSGRVTEDLRYSGRDYIGGKTVFSFYPYNAGDYLIHIRKTDYSAGSVDRRTIMLEVIELPPGQTVQEPEAAEPAVAEKAGGTIPPAETTAAVEPAPAPEDAAVYTTAAEAVEAANRLEQAGDCAGAAGILEDFILSSGADGLDEALFILAGYYEKCTAVRDERKAVSYYRQIVDYYPVSIYWEGSRERIRYLERQYIYIR